MNSEDNQRSIKEQEDKLAALGNGLAQIKFRYKISNEVKTEYWEKYVEDFKRYSEKGMQYYSQAYLLMGMIEKERAELFLLEIAKLRQLSSRLLELLEEVKRNPSIISVKDRQKSRWSKEIRDQVMEYCEKNLNHEKRMNLSFREFYNSRSETQSQ